MVHLFRLSSVLFLRAFVACAVFLTLLPAQAQIAPVTGEEFSCGTGWFPTAQQAAADYNANGGPAGYWQPPFYFSGGSCIGHHPVHGGAVNMRNGTRRESTSCPANSTLTGATCSCDTGYVQDGSICIPYVDPKEAYCNSMSGSLVVGAWYSTTRDVSTPKSYCSSSGLGDCAATLRPTFCGTDQDGVTTCEGEGTLTGATCTPSDPLVPTAPDSPTSSGVEPLPKGMCPGTVNGVEVTVPCKDTTTSTKKESVNDDGNGNVESKTENKVTACTGSSCNTTTTTTTTVNGTSSTSTNTTTQSKGQFCADNPGSVECGDGEGSSFSGSCQSDFACDGDAIQCAIAKEIYKQNCKINETTDESALYNASKNETGSQIGDLPRNETKNIGPGSFNTTNLLGAQTCISDKAITVMGQSITLPFSTVCQYLEMLGNLLLSVSFLLAGRIIIRG